MTTYELMIIGNPKVDSEAVFALVDRALKEVSAKSVKVDKLGKKLLAYPVAGQTEGEYVVFAFQADGGAIAQISGKLKLAQESILRYLITRVKETKGTKGTEVAEATVETKVITEKDVTAKPEGKEKKAKATVKVRAKPKE